MTKYIDNNGLKYFLQKIINVFVKKDGDKVLSDNNYTDTEKNKLASLKNTTFSHTKVLTTQEIAQNTNYTVPEYTLGDDSLSVFFEGCKLIKEKNYIEVDSTHIQFKDWTVPSGSNLEIIVRN